MKNFFKSVKDFFANLFKSECCLDCDCFCDHCIDHCCICSKGFTVCCDDCECCN
jgi:hypothetical protein